MHNHYHARISEQHLSQAWHAQIHHEARTDVVPDEELLADHALMVPCIGGARDEAGVRRYTCSVCTALRIYIQRAGSGARYIM